MDIPAQIIGVVAAICGVLSFQMKTSGKILIVQTIGSMLWMVHFFMLSAYTGAYLNIFSVVRNVLYYILQVKKVKGKIYFSTAMAVIGIGVALLSYSDLWTLLPLVATAIQSYSFSITRAKYLRIATLFASPFWLVYDLHFHSYMGVATEVFVMISMVVALIRYRNFDETKEVEN
jgi:hypothetical protein